MVVRMRALLIVAAVHTAAAGEDTSGRCAENAVKGVCECDHYSPTKGYQCSKCKNPLKWGYGCDVDCDPKCTLGCDMSGNCRTGYCKRNGRSAHKTSENEVTNVHGVCQACENGWHGTFCEHRCPKNCRQSRSKNPSPEGTCTRGGKCYRCEDGWFGEKCDKKCPATCPSCVMKDGLEPMKGDSGEVEFWPAGACAVQCPRDNWGASCEHACPGNCKKSRIPSCLKETGNCRKCKDHKWWGPKCENKCGEGCAGGTCNKEDGTCEDGCRGGWWGRNCDKRCSEGVDGSCDAETGFADRCKPGWWGDSCENQCPEGTVNTCRKITGLPADCEKHSYPGYWKDEKAEEYEGESGLVAACLECPITCKDQDCKVLDGKVNCLKGCEEGNYGKKCNLACPGRCAGPCDAKTTGQKDGTCAECQDGWTGKFCTKKCHSTCAACNPRHDATGPKDCTKCDPNEPVELVNGECACIAGASRRDGKCYCDDPLDDEMKIGRFEVFHNHKVCTVICKTGYKLILGSKKDSVCMRNSRVEAVFYAAFNARQTGKTFTEGGCEQSPDPQWEIPVGEDSTTCIRKDFVADITKG